MRDQALVHAVAGFAQAMQDVSEQDLEREWTWRYHEEGVRFALLGTYHELRDLAVTTAAQRAASNPPTIAQRVLAQYHGAYRDLQGVLLGVDEEMAMRAPAEGEWPVWVALWHMIQTELAFFPQIRHALQRWRAGDREPREVPDDQWLAFLTAAPATDPTRLLNLIFGDAVKTLEAAEVAPIPERPHGAFAEFQAYYDGLHEHLLRELAGVADEELRATSLWWEGSPVEVHFRLHRYDAHLRQHTIQIEKALEQLGRGPNEARRLLRLIYAALTEAEGAAIGAWEVGAAERETLAQAIAARADEIAGVLARKH